MACVLLLQSAELVSDPARPPGWVLDDPGVLQGAGATSAAIPQVMQRLVPQLDGLAPLLERPGATFLDIGSGVALMSVAACRGGSRSGSSCARAPRRSWIWTVSSTWPGCRARSSSPRPSARSSRRRCGRSSRAVGPRSASTPDDLARALVALRTVRSGGAVTDAATAAGILRDAGFTDVHVPVRNWSAPVEFVFGRRPGG